MAEELYKLPGGGTRSEKQPPYHLVPPEGAERTALRFGLGAEKHGAFNWMQSIQSEADALSWAREAYNHMISHAQKMAAGTHPDDDHLGAIGWAQSVLCHIEAKYKKLWTSLDGQIQPRGMK